MIVPEFFYPAVYYGNRMVPGKKNILSGGRHLIYLAAAPKLSRGRHLLYDGRHLIIWRPPFNLYGGHHLVFMAAATYYLATAT